jgi:uncharacterized protein related to proFAR isomerase
MPESLLKAKRRQATIREVLLKEWDPIGVARSIEAQDEYEGYVADIDALLARSASPAEIFAHLWNIETVIMGLTGDRMKTEAIARRLFEVAQT